MKSILFFILYVIPFWIHAQVPSLKLNISDLKCKNKSISFLCAITNDSAIGLSVFTPIIDNVCVQIFGIYMTDIKSKRKYDIFPCTVIPDLRYINADTSNCAFIKRNGDFEKTLEIPKIDLAFLIPNRLYELSLIYKYPVYTSVKTEMPNMYIGEISSNKLRFVYK